jgi:hypothetical protein
MLSPASESAHVVLGAASNLVLNSTMAKLLCQEDFLGELLGRYQTVYSHLRIFAHFFSELRKPKLRLHSTACNHMKIQEQNRWFIGLILA